MSVRRAWRALAATGALAVLLASCGFDSEARVDPRSLRRRVRAAGAEICAEGSTTTHFNDQRSARWYEIARDCASADGPELLVGVIEFASDAARDAAYADQQHRVRRLTHNAVVFKAAHSLVVMSRIRDRGLLEDVAAELD